MRVPAGMCRAAAVLLLAAIALAGVPQSGSAQTYRDKRLGFTFSLPGELVPQPGADALLTKARHSAAVPGDRLALECLTIPVRLMSPAGKLYERFVFFETDFGCLARDYPTYIRSFTQSSMEDLVRGCGAIGEGFGRDYRIDNHKAGWETVTVAANAVEPGLVLYAAQDCIALERTVACWNFVTSDRARLHVLGDLQFQLDGYKGRSLTTDLRLRSEVSADK